MGNKITLNFKHNTTIQKMSYFRALAKQSRTFFWDTWSCWGPPCPPSCCPPRNCPYLCEFIFYVFWDFDKGVTSIFNDVLHDHVEVLHVLPLAVHLGMVLRMVFKVPSVAHKSKSHHWPANYGDGFRSKICKLKDLSLAPNGKMSAGVLGCCHALIELKIFLVSPNTIYFDLKKVSEDAINILNSNKVGK